MNNLRELFEIQAGLDAEILKNHPIQPGEDRLEKKHTSLLVELGEMFNEWRAFKFWSHDQEPRMEVECPECDGAAVSKALDGSYVECGTCDGTGTIDKVLKELVDCLHFVLSIGLEHGFDTKGFTRVLLPLRYESDTMEYNFIQLMQYGWSYEGYEEGLCLFLGFCDKLGYTWEQVTAAYLEKNQENHYRQMNGY